MLPDSSEKAPAAFGGLKDEIRQNLPFRMAVALDSVWTVLPAVAAVVIAVIRTRLEDGTLQDELPGYREYSERVRYRLIPGIY